MVWIGGAGEPFLSDPQCCHFSLTLPPLPDTSSLPSAVTMFPWSPAGLDNFVPTIPARHRSQQDTPSWGRPARACHPQQHSRHVRLPSFLLMGA